MHRQVRDITRHTIYLWIECQEGLVRRPAQGDSPMSFPQKRESIGRQNNSGLSNPGFLPPSGGGATTGSPVRLYEGKGGNRFDRVGFKPDPIIN